MKKAGYLFYLSAAVALFVAGYQGLLHARMIGTNPTGTSADEFCVGGTIRAATTINATEVCLDSSGNWIPTTDNTQTLGTASLRFKTINAGTGGVVTVGPETVGAAGTASTLNGVNAVAPVNQTVLGLNVLTPQTYTISASSTIPVNSSFEILFATGTNNILLTSLPNISTATLISGTTVALPIGSEIVLGSTQSVQIQLQDNGTLVGSGVLLVDLSSFTITNRSFFRGILGPDLLWHQVAAGRNGN